MYDRRPLLLIVMLILFVLALLALDGIGVLEFSRVG